jgi:pre-mRNA-splicing factor ATP-dependent RNA helicase DHX38/PRP16
MDRLEGTTGNEFGGLINKKKQNTGEKDTDHLFKKPSLLGLEKLAKAKRQENLRKNDESTRSESGLSDSVRSEIRRYV